MYPQMANKQLKKKLDYQTASNVRQCQPPVTWKVPRFIRKQFSRLAKYWLSIPDYVYNGSRGEIQRINFSLEGFETMRLFRPFYQLTSLIQTIQNTKLFNDFVNQQMFHVLAYLDEYYSAFNFRLPLMILNSDLKVCFLNVSKYTHSLPTCDDEIMEYSLEINLLCQDRKSNQTM